MGDFVYGKAMDDRVCLAIMDRLLDVLDRDRLGYELVFVSTVQEEIGLVAQRPWPTRSIANWPLHWMWGW